MATTISFQTFPKLFLPEFQKRNSWIVTIYSDENEEKAEFYNAYFIYKHYYCSVCGTVEITKKRQEEKITIIVDILVKFVKIVIF